MTRTSTVRVLYVKVIVFAGSAVAAVESSEAAAAPASGSVRLPALAPIPSASPSPLPSPSPMVTPRHEGSLVRKHEWESATLKSTHRNWKQLHAVLDGDRLSFYTEMKHSKSVCPQPMFLGSFHEYLFFEIERQR